MKVLSKKLFAFFMVLCMIAPMLMVPAFATDNTPHGGIPEECIAVSESEVMPLLNPLNSFETSESDQMVDDGISPHLSSTDRDMGVGIRSITIYPMGVNLETGELFVHPNVYKRIFYVNWSQFGGLNLSKSDTLSLMQQLASIISSGGDNYRLAGWCLVGAVEFHYRNPHYLLYQRRGTGLDPNAQPDTKREISAYSTESMLTLYLYPSNVNVLEDYYFVGVSGGCYYTTPSGNASDALFQYSATFNN